MPRKKKVDTSFALNEEGHEDKITTAEGLQSWMSQYAASVILDRAVPGIDGLKPVQRRLLYTMWKMGLVNGKHTKLNNIGGQTMVLHPHGDQSAAVYTMGAEWLNNVPYAKIDGNGGTINRGIDDAAATRYTSASLTPASEYLMHGLKENAVEMVPNYDETTVEPKILPTEYPNVLMNRVEGIGVGIKPQIYPHNPQEIMNGILYYIDHPKAKPEGFAKIIHGLDVPTGGLLVNSETANLYELKYGRTNKIKGKKNVGYILRGKAEIVEDKEEPHILISSIPYEVTTEDLISSLNDFSEKHSDLGMVDLRDETTDYDNINISIIFKKNISKTALQSTLALLYKETLMQKKYYPINLLIINGHPKVVSITEYLKAWLNFRKEFTKREFLFELDKKEKRFEIVEGLLKLVEISDEVVKDARASTSKSNFQQVLIKKYKFTQRQAEAIATIQLYRLGKQDTKALTKEKKELTKEINRLKTLLNNEKAFMNEIKKELTNIRDTVFKDATRKTKLVNETLVDDIKIDKTALIKKKDALVVAKRNGVIQRMSQQVYDNNINDYPNKDNIVATIKSNTRQGALFFTKFGLAYFRFVNNLENTNVKNDPTSVQQTIPSYKVQDETIGADVFNMKSKEKRYIVSVTKYGAVKVTDESLVIPNTNTKAYLTRTTKYNGLKNLKKYDDEEVIFVKVLTQKDYDEVTLTITKTRGTTGRVSSTNIKLSEMNVQGAAGSGSQKVKLSEKLQESITDIKLH